MSILRAKRCGINYNSIIEEQKRFGISPVHNPYVFHPAPSKQRL